MKIFIDANIYITLYTTKSAISFLDTIQKISNYIFVTRQIRNEVVRNRLNITCQCIKNIEDDKNKKANNSNQNQKLQHPNYPDWFSCSNTNEDNKKVYKKVLQDVYQGKDKISKVLEAIFKSSTDYTIDQLKRARLRKELGNPPGKPKDPLGDQISWEQFLDSIVECKGNIFVVSADSDFVKKYQGQSFLNPYLMEELIQKNIDSNQIFAFSDLPSALEKYKELEDRSIVIPSSQELKTLREEQIKNDNYLICRSEGHIPLSYTDGIYLRFRCQRCGQLLASYLNDDIDC
ncbi:PIN domain-containing protein [Baaleninema simplex]|uniref:PIN domain-containing protein n=1 Tax=Baaleninema simplex TaxID=2862350 RepID=UPI00034C63A0|nr:PIN domain-containing protein [Baaleninema simplex]